MTDSWDVRILTASYRREGPQEEPVIELFGRTREGKSVAVEYRGFKPYFHAVRPSQVLVNYFSKDSEVLKVEPLELEVQGRKTPCAKVTLQHPWKTPEYRERARKHGSDVLAADIPFAHRFIFDFDLAACVRVHGAPSTGKYTTDLVVKAERFEPCDPFNPRLKVVSFDIENTIKDPTILCLGLAWREDGGEIRTDILTGHEKDIILGFIEFVKRHDPDVITGYNIDGYDLPIMEQRAQVHGIPVLPLSRDGQGITNIGERFWRTHGRIIADAWWAVKLELHPKQESLDAVARWLLGEGKHDVDRVHMDDEWARNRERVLEYCKKDAELALRVLEKVARLDKAMDLGVVSKLPVDDTFNSRTSTMIDSILIRAADRQGVGVPMTRTGGGGKSIEGGYVHSLEPGLYEWVIALDFSSMYPSIIIEKNICFTTLSDAGTIESPMGVRFMNPQQRVGLLPKILGDLLRQRREVKAKMKAEADPERKEYYRRLQDAVKVLMNAFYGVLASSFYRFTNPEIGASITAFARENIKSVISQLEADGVRVIYSDTDSIFLESPSKDKDGSVAFGRKVAERFSAGNVNMELERVFRSFFSHGKKKRYAAKTAWPVEDELIVRGYEIRRTDAFNLQSESQKRDFDLVLDNDTEGAVRLAKELVAEIHAGRIPQDMVLEDGEPLEPLVISRTVSEDSRYVNPDSMSNVLAARKMRELGYEVVPGMKVSWIVVDAKKAPMHVEPWVSGRPFEFKPDWEYYARRVAQTLAYVTEVYGWDERSLLMGTVQADLFHENFDGEKEEPKKVEVLKTDKKLTLEDFF
ncbi:MAG: DNA polymerase II [Euryarchaeota archaeon RBG_16_68_12]|nr:MAG: DNA polymerase II [Euryarchaeota archaeon RBG_16_68_12]